MYTRAAFGRPFLFGVSMTTIAFDGEYLYSDSQVTYAQRKSNIKKMFRVGNKYIAIAGDVSRWPSILKAVEANIGISSAVGSDSTLFLVKDKKLTIYSEGETWEQAAPDFAGTGAPYAFGAHKAGSSVKDSVKIAASLDLYSGGPIKQLKV